MLKAPPPESLKKITIAVGEIKKIEIINPYNQNSEQNKQFYRLM